MSNFNISDFIHYKQTQQKITMATAYDYPSARLLETAGIDIILVGDSLGMVFQGNNDTLGVTIENIIYHSQAVRKGAPESFIVADLPYLSYHTTTINTIQNAGHIIAATKVNAVKIEINHPRTFEHLEALLSAQIPVIAHLGMTPQSVNIFGGFKVQGKQTSQAQQICEFAKQAQQSGACALVLECIPASLTKMISEQLTIPVIGIGAGSDCDGQVLVLQDLLGMTDSPPRFVKPYLNGQKIILRALNKYIREVKNRQFPTLAHSFKG